MPYNSETETFYQSPATVVDSTPDGDTVQEGFDDRLTPAMAGLYADLNLLKADGMISVGIPATTTSRGIARVATLADMEPGAEVENGPAFLAAGSDAVTPTPTPNTIMCRDEAGRVRVEDPVHDKDVANKTYVDNILIWDAAGSITLNGTTNNTVVMTNIVPELALEVGDVIRIDAGAYNKLHTVESITDNSSIIVNYEHAGNRGNGSLKLPDFTGQATVTRIAKWFNAPLGLGQAWLDVMSQRSSNTTYQNTTGKPIGVYIDAAHAENPIQVSSDGSSWVIVGKVGKQGVYIAGNFTVVPNGHYCKFFTGNVDWKPLVWSELR